MLLAAGWWRRQRSTRRHRFNGESAQSRAWVWKGEWDAVIDDALLFKVRAGQFGNGRTGGPAARRRGSRTSKRCVVTGGNRDWQTSGAAQSAVRYR